MFSARSMQSESDVDIDLMPDAPLDSDDAASQHNGLASGTPSGVAAEDEDQAQLKALGFQSEFKRDMSPWANFSLGFTYLSPVVGIYTVFAFALAAAGPPMIWSLLIAGVGPDARRAGVR